MDELTMGHALVHEMLPAAVAAAAAAGLWLLVCRRIHRDAEQRHREAIKLPDGYESMPVGEKLAIAADRRRLAGRGSPADRLFFTGLAVASIIVLAILGLWASGLAPASTSEREFISLLRESPFAERSQMAAALAAVDSSIYVSRQHFFTVQAAFAAVSQPMGVQAK